MDHAAIAGEMLAAYGTDRLLTRPTEQYPGFSLDDGYRVAHLLRDLRVARASRCWGARSAAPTRRRIT